MLEKLGLGTVQFGQAYGVSNARGQVPARKMPRHPEPRGRRPASGLLDTAANYGEAETVLAKLDTCALPRRHQDHRSEHGLDSGDRARPAIGGRR